MDQGQTMQVAPTDVELERAIASVPGVVSAGIDRSVATGKSRMRLRLAPGEDEEAVSWAVAATLRERFGIALDPDAIRPRPAETPDPEHDPVRVVRGLDGDDATPEVDAEVGRRPSDGPSPDLSDPRSRLANELADTRERLRLAAARALDGVADLDGLGDLDSVGGLDNVGGLGDVGGLDGVGGVGDVGGLDGVGGVGDIVDLAELLDDAGSMAAGSGRVEAVAGEPEVGTDARVGGEGHGHRVSAGTADDADPLEAQVRDAAGYTDRQSRAVIPRAAIRDLQIHRDARSVRVAVVLAHGERAEEGRATSVPTSHGTLRAVAEATVAALRALTEGPLLVGIDRVSAKHGEDSPVATVVLSLLTRRGEERLLGASIIRDSPERAVLRATLDALNRRVMPLLLDRDAQG